MRAEMIREVELRRADPLAGAAVALTRKGRFGGAQWDFVSSAARERILEGGNQSGKTWCNCVDFLMQARGVHPTIRWTARYPGETWRGWYATTTYQRFAEQAWKHFKRLLLFPGESVLHLPTRRIVGALFDKRNPERVLYLKLRREPGRGTETRTEEYSEIFVKSYESGAGEFQSAEVDLLALDEECSQAIYDEAQPRVLVHAGRISVSATPILGVPWLAKLREAAEQRPDLVTHTRLSLRDNPGCPPDEIAKIEFALRGRPELIRLRLDGFPVALEGLVYPDTIFTPAHVVDPFVLGPDWTRFRVCDPGWRNFACLWFAIAPRNLRIVCYRDYLGQGQTVAQNALAVTRLSGLERYERTYVDPAALITSAEGGRRVIDLLNRPVACWACGQPWVDRHRPGWCAQCGLQCGLEASPAPDNAVQAGVDAVAELLNQRTGPQGEWPLFGVWRACTHFLEERRQYMHRSAGTREDERPDRPVKRGDHCMDCWRYFVAARPRWQPPRAARPPAGSIAELLQNDRRPPVRGVK